MSGGRLFGGELSGRAEARRDRLGSRAGQPVRLRRGDLAPSRVLEGHFGVGSIDGA